MMQQLPVASAETILTVDRIRGKFQGEMAPSTPMGAWVAMIRIVSSSYWSSSSRVTLS